MRTNGNDYANPVSSETMDKYRKGHYSNAGESKPFGMTKREQFAMAAMQGLLQQNFKSENLDKVIDVPKNISKWAVLCADELINALNK